MTPKVRLITPSKNIYNRGEGGNIIIYIRLDGYKTINTNLWREQSSSNFQHNTRVVMDSSNALDRFREQLKRFKEVITDVK